MPFILGGGEIEWRGDCGEEHIDEENGSGIRHEPHREDNEELTRGQRESWLNAREDEVEKEEEEEGNDCSLG